jgi:hypothetical protein
MFHPLFLFYFSNNISLSYEKVKTNLSYKKRGQATFFINEIIFSLMQLADLSNPSSKIETATYF